jgi:hypothetical protein
MVILFSCDYLLQEDDMTITKYCAKCKETKDIAEFNKNKARKDGVDTYCKKCHHAVRMERLKNNPISRRKHNQSASKHRENNREKVREKNKNYRINNPDKVKESAKRWKENNLAYYKRMCRESKLKRLYGLTIEQYDDMLLKQNGLCCLCSNPAQVVDHCHITNKVRGLLCHMCNKGLQRLKDNIETMEKAIKYLNT